ncbi:TIGR03435 family protein [Granulicella sp. S156]|uniref:TIGR03435 family protein n=1 Tax=Granulicella sp. S156 TaxID=1747224 RepID=UPI00131D41F8|nr:TIGR03435 family protein [Granulicella sp. S156]
MKRSLLLLLLIGGSIPSMAQDPNDNEAFHRSRHVQHPQRPEFSPSDTVHISPTQKEIGTSMWSAPNYWITQGYELQGLVGMLYDYAATRIEFEDPELAQQRYDVALVLPNEEDEAAMKESIRIALQRELGLLITRDVRRRDVYIVTAPHGPGPKLRESRDMGGFTATHSLVTVLSGKSAPTREDIEQLQLSKRANEGIAVDSISISSGTITEFCSTLEQSLDRPVVDESQLQGRYSFELRREKLSRDQFFERIQKELGLLVSPGEREVAMLIVQRK